MAVGLEGHDRGLGERLGDAEGAERGEFNLLPGLGYRVRTLHSLANDIVRERLIPSSVISSRTGCNLQEGRWAGAPRPHLGAPRPPTHDVEASDHTFGRARAPLRHARSFADEARSDG